MFLSWFDSVHHDPEQPVEGSEVQSERIKALGSAGLSKVKRSLLRSKLP